MFLQKVLYLSSRNLTCPNLKYNINKNILNGTMSLNSYKWTGENMSNLNVDHK